MACVFIKLKDEVDISLMEFWATVKKNLKELNTIYNLFVSNTNFN